MSYRTIMVTYIESTLAVYALYGLCLVLVLKACQKPTFSEHERAPLFALYVPYTVDIANYGGGMVAFLTKCEACFAFRGAASNIAMGGLMIIM